MGAGFRLEILRLLRSLMFKKAPSLTRHLARRFIFLLLFIENDSH